MTIIRQESLFGIQGLYEMEPTQKYEEIMAAIDLDVIFSEINKKSRFDAPTEFNYGAMLVSVFVRYIERDYCIRIEPPLRIFEPVLAVK